MKRSLPLILVWLALCTSSWADAPALAEGASAHPPYRGSVPKKSDVVFSTRFKRVEAPEVIRSFRATRVEWVYTNDAEFAQSLEKAAPWFGGAINANGPLKDEAGYARDFDGQVLVAPWMKGWNGRWVSTTHPETRRVITEQLRRYAELGVDSMQADDPLLQMYTAIYQAGDFNPATVEGFPDWLARHPEPVRVAAAGLDGFKGDYREWLRSRQRVTNAQDYTKRFRSFPSTPLWMEYIQSTVRQHFVDVRRQLEQARGKPVALSMNLGILDEPNDQNRQYFLADLADYAIAETRIDDYASMVAQSATFRALGLGFVPSLKPGTLEENRIAIATLYALGTQPVVPWDVYVGNDERGQAKRLFGTADEYGHLYQFVRAHPEVVDGLETAVLVGVLAPVSKFRSDATKALVRKLVERQIPFAYVPVGGKVPHHKIDVGRIKHLRALLSVNDADDLPADAREAIAAAGVPLLDVRAMKDDRLADWQPFLIAPGSERVRIIPRAAPGDPSRLVLHIIDTSRAGQTQADPTCRRRLGIRRQLLGGAKVTGEYWSSMPPGTRLEAVDSGARDLFVTLQGCPLWGVLEVRMQR